MAKDKKSKNKITLSFEKFDPEKYNKAIEKGIKRIKKGGKTKVQLDNSLHRQRIQKEKAQLKKEKEKEKKLRKVKEKDFPMADLPDEKQSTPKQSLERMERYESGVKAQKKYNDFIRRGGKTENYMSTKPNLRNRKKLAKGGFPDLSGDGKVTKKDVLIGSGVKMNKGGMNKKMPVYGKGGLKPAKSTYNMGGMKKQYGVKNYMYGGSVMGKKKK